MDKLVAATTENASNHIHDDVALAILSKLPIKSLFRFLCVSKSWSFLFQNSYFMDIFRRSFLFKNHFYYNDTSLLLYHIAFTSDVPYKYESKLYSLSSEKSMLKFDWPNPFQEQCDFYIYGSSVNGIFCITRLWWPNGIPNIEELGRFVLWNPATHECKVPPPSPFAFKFPCWDPLIDFHGFGYDQVSDDYKVVRHITFDPRTDEDYKKIWKDGFPESLWEIYSLKCNCWRKLDLDMPAPNIGGVGQVYTDGVCHWCCESETGDEDILVSFDLNNETFVKTSIPLNMDYIDYAKDLIMLNGSIVFISNYVKTGTFHSSILGEVGIKESWIKLFTVGPLPCVEELIGIGMKGDIFFRKNDHELVWFNLHTQKIEELGVKGDYSCQVMMYKESFLPFERINNYFCCFCTRVTCLW